MYDSTMNKTADTIKIEMPNDILLGCVRDTIRAGHTATIGVKGYSMRPFLEHCRDKVLLSAPHQVRLGDAVLAEITPGHYVLHRVIAMNGEELVLMGDGNVRGCERCRLKDVAGVVSAYIYPHRRVSADHPTLCRAVRLWRRLLPVRRYLLLVYRALVKCHVIPR